MRDKSSSSPESKSWFFFFSFFFPWTVPEKCLGFRRKTEATSGVIASTRYVRTYVRTWATVKTKEDRFFRETYVYVRERERERERERRSKIMRSEIGTKSVCGKIFSLVLNRAFSRLAYVLDRQPGSTCAIAWQFRTRVIRCEIVSPFGTSSNEYVVPRLDATIHYPTCRGTIIRGQASDRCTYRGCDVTGGTREGGDSTWKTEWKI